MIFNNVGILRFKLLGVLVLFFIIINGFGIDIFIGMLKGIWKILLSLVSGWLEVKFLGVICIDG